MIPANFIRYLKTPLHSGFQSAGLLVVRLIAGGAFVVHGWGKIQDPIGWAGPQSTIPGVFLFLAALSEFGGGFAWIFGFLTPLASLGIFCTMTVAVHMHMIVRQDPFVNMSGGMSYEPALGYWGISILLLTMGPGRFSADAKIFGQRG